MFVISDIFCYIYQYSINNTKQSNLLHWNQRKQFVISHILLFQMSLYQFPLYSIIWVKSDHWPFTFWHRFQVLFNFVVRFSGIRYSEHQQSANMYTILKVFPFTYFNKIFRQNIQTCCKIKCNASNCKFH